MWYEAIIVGLLLAVGMAGQAQVTFRIVDLPASTPPDAGIYISGDFEGWSGGQDGFQLNKGPDGYYFITIPQRTGTIQYKFTLGSWAKVERDSSGYDIENRTYVFGGEGEMIDVSIAAWAVGSAPLARLSTAGRGVHILAESFFMPQLDRGRRIWIYLPPGYNMGSEHYPVLYMADGQNIFDDSTAYAGEWGVDETLDSLHETDGIDIIVVGVENGLGGRIDEYSPWINPDWGGGRGEDYVAFITETLVPYMDAHYRTLKGPEYTGLMGSSMGGLISHYGGVANPKVFGRLGVFSPPFAIFDSCYAYTASRPAANHQRYYFAAGGMESENLDVPAATAHMVDVMQAAGYRADQLRMVVDPQGHHNEQFWRRQFADAIVWLY